MRLLALLFIKNIIEQADKYKLVFVVKHGTINTDRGRPLLDLSASVKKVFANQVLSNIAGVVVTETRQTSPVNMFNNIKAKTDFENISAFKENAFWPFAGHLLDQETQKNNILDGITNLTFSQPFHPEEHQELNDSINIGELLSHEAKNKLLELFSEHHKQIFIDEYSYYENQSINDPITIEDVEKKC